MKKFFLFAAVALMAASCTSDPDTLHESAVTNPEPTQVVLTFSPYQMEAMTRAGSVPGDSVAGSRRAPTTRAATSISSVVTHLDVWLYEGGAEVAAIHQDTDTDGFGSVSVVLDKRKTYTLYAVGHRASGAATLADGIISFPDDKVTHSMYCAVDFTPSTAASLNCEMQRIVAQFAFASTDICTDDVAKMRFTLGSVYDRWSVTDGATHSLDRVSTFDGFNKREDGTVGFNLYAIATDEQTLHTVTVEALSATNEVLQSRTFQDVPLRNGYKTTYQGVFFTNTSATATFTVGDWSEFDVTTF